MYRRTGNFESRNMQLVSSGIAKLSIFAALSLLLTSVWGGDRAFAEIKASAKDGFHISVTKQVDLGRNQAFKTFVSELSKWWDSSHTYSGDSKNVALDLKQKCMIERLPEGGFVRHMEIVFYQPGKMLRLTGGLGPLQGMGVDGALNVSFSETDGSATVRLNYLVNAASFQNLEQVAKPVDRVLTEQMTRFKKHCDAIAAQEADSEKEKTESKSDRGAPTANKKAKQAAKILKHEEGTWKCSWDYLAADGSVASSVKGSEVMKLSFDGKILEMKTYVGEKLVSKSMRFYNSATEKLTLISVGADGNYWEMTQDPDSDVMVSKPHKTADGGSEYLRFKVIESTKNSMSILMERSTDYRKWTKVFRQKMVRVEHKDE